MEIPDYPIKDIDLYWLAGILEGEGSFLNARNHVKGKLYLYPRIVVTMTDRDIIDRVSSLFDTSTYIVPNKRPEDRKDQFRALINGSRAAGLMSRLFPIMSERRQSKIDEILLSYEELESTEVRLKRSCSIAQKNRRRNEKGQYGKSIN